MKATQKLRIMGLVLLLFLLAGCDTDSGADRNGGNAEKDSSQLTLTEQTKTLMGDFLETQDAYYYGNGFLLYVCPKDGDTFVPLCSKPDCKHNSEDCNACYSGLFHAIWMYNGSLYTVGSPDYALISVEKRNLDGTDYRILATVNLLDYARDTDELNPHVYLYRDKAYFFISTLATLPIAQEDHLIAVDLTDGTQTELAEDFFRERRFPYAIPIIENGKLRERVAIDKSSVTSQEELVDLDLQTGKWEAFPIPLDTVCGYSITDSTVYYWERKVGDLIPERPGFKEYDRKTGEIKEFGMPVEDENIWSVMYDTDFIYMYPKLNHDEVETLYILRRDYSLADQIRMPERQAIIAVTSERIYLTDPEAEINEENCSENAICYLEKSKIGSGELAPVKVSINVPTAAWEYSFHP